MYNVTAVRFEYSRAMACMPMSLFVLTIEQANRSVSQLGFDNQAASATVRWKLSILAVEKFL